MKKMMKIVKMTCIKGKLQLLNFVVGKKMHGEAYVSKRVKVKRGWKNILLNVGQIKEREWKKKIKILKK